MKQGIYNKNWNCIEVKDDSIDTYIEFICKNEIESIHICDLYYTADNIDFLKRCPSVKEVNLNSYHIKNIDAIYASNNLISLIINEAPCKIELNRLLKLEYLATDYSDIVCIEELCFLKSLYLVNYNSKHKNLLDLKKLERLESLELVHSNVVSLDGIGALQRMKNLSIGYFKKLNDISDLKNNIKLQYLRIDDSPKIKDFSIIGNLKNLKSLALCDDKEMESIHFISDLHYLDSFIFIGTVVKDGIIFPCKKLKHVEFDNKKHYTNKNNEFPKEYD